MTRSERTRLKWGLFFISPWIAGFCVFTLYPALASVYFSFTDFNAINLSPKWVGLDNYVNLFKYDDKFWTSLEVTAKYVAMLVVSATVVDIIAAVLLNMKVRGLSFYRTMLFLPVVVPTVAAIMAWVWILNPKHGLINGVLAQMGIKGPYWLASPKTALLSLVIIAVIASGRSILIYLAGVQDIPSSLYDAASIDGANSLQRLRHITLPLLTPQILYNVVILIIFSMQAFAEPHIMTRGGPANSTLLYSLYLYQRAFRDLSMGYASAMAWILFVIILVLTLLLLRSSRHWAIYDR